MPNICTNRIKISGKQSEIAELKNYFKIEDDSIYLDLNKIAKEFELGDDNYATGTKWFELYDTLELFDDVSEIIIDASTAWSPCLEGFTALSTKFKSLNINYDYSESSVGFSGRAIIANGVINDQLYSIEDKDTTEYYKLMIELEYESVDDYVGNLEIESEEDIDEDLPRFIIGAIKRKLNI